MDEHSFEIGQVDIDLEGERNLLVTALVPLHIGSFSTFSLHFNFLVDVLLEVHVELRIFTCFLASITRRWLVFIDEF